MSWQSQVDLPGQVMPGVRSSEPWDRVTLQSVGLYTPKFQRHFFLAKKQLATDLKISTSRDLILTHWLTYRWLSLPMAGTDDSYKVKQLSIKGTNRKSQKVQRLGRSSNGIVPMLTMHVDSSRCPVLLVKERRATQRHPQKLKKQFLFERQGRSFKDYCFSTDTWNDYHHRHGWTKTTSDIDWKF